MKLGIANRIAVFSDDNDGLMGYSDAVDVFTADAGPDSDSLAQEWLDALDDTFCPATVRCPQ
jgi:hypothetical protein